MMGDTANDIRGEIEVSLAGRTRVLRPSYTAIRAVERQTKLSLREAQAAAAHLSLTVDAVGIILAELIKAGADDDDIGGKQGEADRWGELAYEAGMPSIQTRIALVLLGALSGGYTASGEVKAEPVRTMNGTGSAD